MQNHRDTEIYILACAENGPPTPFTDSSCQMCEILIAQAHKDVYTSINCPVLCYASICVLFPMKITAVPVALTQQKLYLLTLLASLYFVYWFIFIVDAGWCWCSIFGSSFCIFKFAHIRHSSNPQNTLLRIICPLIYPPIDMQSVYASPDKRVDFVALARQFCV